MKQDSLETECEIIRKMSDSVEKKTKIERFNLPRETIWSKLENQIIFLVGQTENRTKLKIGQN